MAVFRALESTKPANERLFFDPFAGAFASRFYRTILAACSVPFVRKTFEAYIQLRWPGTYTAAVARTRLIDDMITKAVREDGINQIFILNATLDTRAHRLDIGMPVSFVEVNHPDTQNFKQKQIWGMLGNAEMPAVHVDYVKLDMSRQQLADTISPILLQKSRYKTLFLWEALTTSMEAAQAESLFEFIKSYPPGTQVIITYADKDVFENPRAYPGFSRIYKALRHAGENWDYGMNAGDVTAFMRERNMQLLYDGGADKYREQYFGEKSKCMKGYEYFRVMRSELK
ncbi:SAM-dependent methyltransferase [Chitinophaga sp. Mgbs1]|uniref:S-adenosyl-L-methionine-dependent methyltransferase n=2 Tax=Chitinophaga solisilvae TaxID=1233460 RepID=A0A9Q5DC84_9BACT|nr:SAM-dependent methyltransferase [Chitinophaga solisilvae]